MIQENYILSLKKIRNAFIMILFSFNLNTMDLLPDWLGYIWILQSIHEIGKEERSALLLKDLLYLLIGYYSIKWLLNTIGIEIDNYLIVTIFTIIKIYVSFQLIANIIDISIKHQSDKTNKLRIVRDMITILFTIASIPWQYSESIFMNVIITIIVLLWSILSFKQILDLSSYIKEEQEYKKIQA